MGTKVGEIFFSLGIQPDASWGKVRGMIGGLGNQVRGGLGGARSALRGRGFEGFGPDQPGGAFFGPGSGRRRDGSNRTIDWASATGDPFAVNKGGGGGGRGPKAPGQTPGFFKKLREGVNDLNLFRRALYGTFAVQTIKTVADLADAYTNVHNRLVTLTGSQEEAEKQYQKGRDVAKATRSDLEGTVEAYVRISNATKELGLTSDQTWQFVTSVQQAMQMSGATAEEAKSGMTQFTQALSKGKLDGDEFKSIAENMPSILTLMGKALGKTEGQIREMSKSGQLTRKVIVNAFTKMKDSIATDFGKTVPTVAQSFQQFRNEMVNAVGVFAKNINLAKLASQFFKVLAVVLKVVIFAFEAIFTVINKVIGAFQYLWEAASNGSDLALAALIGIGAVIAAAIIPSLIALGSLIVSTVIPALIDMAVAAWASLGPYALIFAAVALLAYAVIKIVKHWDKVKQLVGDVADGIKEGLSAAFDFIADQPGIKQLIWLVKKLDELTGLGVSDALMTPEQIQAKMQGGNAAASTQQTNLVQGPYGPMLNDPNAATGGGAKTVTIGPTTVSIYANDAADAKRKFDADQLERANRHAAAALSR